jgi:riboflavin-specific deaminase-like protein
LTSRARDDRPYVVANMIATVDGRAALEGRTQTMSTPVDRALFHSLREQVDAVMVGTGTIALERYGPLVRDEERRKRRKERGLEEVPLAVTASRSMELPVEAPLFQDAASRILALTNSSREPPGCPATVEVLRIPGEEIDFVAGMEALRGGHGVRALLLEGGPTVLAAMLASGVVDELFLSLSPLVAGAGGEPSIVEGALPGPGRLRLISLFEDASYLYLRYSVEGPAPA